MGHWNHRVLVHDELNGELFYIIHEVHYNDEGIPEGYTENGTTVCGSSVEEIGWALNHMQECLKRPILWAGDKFPAEYQVQV